MSEQQALIAIEEQLKNELAAISGSIEPPSSNKISTKGKLFTMPDGRSHPGPLKCVVLDFVAFNSYYENPWNANVKAAPVCWALNKTLADLKPSAAAPKPQSDLCSTCPKGQFGSAPQGGKGKACKNTRRLLIAEPQFAEQGDKSEVYTIDVSPTGLKSWNKYVDFLLKAHGVLPLQVLTEITFDKNESYPSLRFDMVDRHANVETALRLRNMHTDMLMREPELKEAA